MRSYIALKFPFLFFSEDRLSVRKKGSSNEA